MHSISQMMKMADLASQLTIAGILLIVTRMFYRMYLNERAAQKELVQKLIEVSDRRVEAKHEAFKELQEQSQRMLQHQNEQFLQIMNSEKSFKVEEIAERDAMIESLHKQVMNLVNAQTERKSWIR